VVEIGLKEAREATGEKMSMSKRTVRLGLLLATAMGATCWIKCAGPADQFQGYTMSYSRVREIGVSSVHYNEVEGALPFGFRAKASGKPLLSWRVSLLPFVEAINLFEDFRLDEAWDGPHNRMLVDREPECFRPPFEAKPVTHLCVFSGPGTAFEHDHIPLTKTSFPNGLSEALLVVEATEETIWTNPANLVYSPDRPLPPLGGLFEKPVTCLGIDAGRRRGFNAAFADGSARFLDGGTSEVILRAMISPRRPGHSETHGR
jgi:prepilin-type processing-associated H-X9-DG protein